MCLSVGTPPDLVFRHVINVLCTPHFQVLNEDV